MIDRSAPGRELSADRTGHNGRNDSARNALLMLRIPGDDGQGVNGGRRDSIELSRDDHVQLAEITAKAERECFG